MTENANIVHKMSLYDLLTLIIPGSIVVALLYLGIFPWISKIVSSWVVLLAAFGAMYLIGLILKNWALQKENNIFDKNIEDIREAYSRFARDTNHTIGRKKITYDDYCADYYYAVSYCANSKVPVLEAQVAFLRTMRNTMEVIFYISLAFFVLNVGYPCSISLIFWFGGMILTCGVVNSNCFIKLAHDIQRRVYEGVVYDSYYHGGPISKRNKHEITQ